MTETKRIRRADILGCVAAELNMPVGDITGEGRYMAQCRARFICVALFMEYDPAVSRPQMGASLGGRDHTTIIHSIRAARKLLKTDPSFAHDLERCRKRVQRWATSEPLAVMVTAPAAFRTSDTENPSAAKIELPAYRPVVSSRSTRYGDEYHDGKMNAQWWLANDLRFQAAMSRAHPELCQPPKLEAAE